MNKPSAQERTNSWLLPSILAFAVILIAALYFKALETDNWRGFWFSAVHVAIVAVGAYLALKGLRKRG